MSTKTMKQRIALVAVSALTAGVLSVMSTPASYAATSDADNVSGNVTTGVAAASTGGTAGSVGLLAEDGAGTTQSAVLLATGALNVFIADDSGASTTASATVTGGRFTLATAATISGTSSASARANATGSAVGLVAVPNAGATSMVINVFQNTYSNATDATNNVVASATNPIRITVTVVATSAYNAYSPTYSRVYWGAGSGADTAVTDATSANSNKASAETLAGDIILADAYGNLLSTANSAILTATVTAGAVVNLGSNSTAGTSTVDFQNISGSIIPFNIQQADGDVPWNGTATFTLGGTVIATKTGVLTGEVAKVTVGSPKIGKKGATNAGAATIAYADSAGNTVYPNSSLTTAVAATMNSIVTGISVGTAAASGVTGLLSMTCSSGTMGAVKGLQVKHTNPSGTVVNSNAWDSGCADVPYTVEASWDKASYTPGAVATLTLLFKDSKGNLANAYDAIGANSAGDDLTVSGGPSAAAVTPIADGDKPSGVTGAKTYQFVVTQVVGDYVAIINPTEIKENNATVTANISLPYTVKSATTSVTNEDILKSIVSLIASINKQIQALQKLILKR
jgi:hypothetical protein